MGQEPSRRGLWDRAEARRRTRDVLAEFGHPEIDPDAVVGRLPIGARQVVEICRAIAARARVVLMDEPTSSLPRGDVDRLFATIGRLSAAGCRRRLHQPLPRGDAGGGVGLHRPARRPHGRDRHARLRDQRRAHRPHGGPHRGRAVPPPRGPARPTTSRSRWPVSPPPGCARPRSPSAGARSSASSASWARGGRRWCGPSSAWPARPPAAWASGGASAASTPRRHGGWRTASATSARTARARGSRCLSPWPTTSP